MEARRGLLVGTHTFASSGDAARRQADGVASLMALRGAGIVNVQFESGAHHVPGVETLAVLRLDSNGITGRRGPRKPVASEVFDALARAASARGLDRFCFTNGDIVVTQEAIERVLSGSRDGWAFSRLDVDRDGRPLGIELAGLDVFALSTAWWAAHRRRFRAYVLGEGGWDNIYAAVLMCHGNAAVENRDGLVRHEKHPHGPMPSPHYGEYIRMLAAFDAGYFTRWCRYWDALLRMRAEGASADEEHAMARRVFAWNPTLTERAVQAGRNVKARVRYLTSRH